MKRYLQISLWVATATILVSIGLIATLGLQFGIDFTGGSLLEVATTGVEPQAVRTHLEQELGLTATVQTTTEETFIIRTVPLNESRHQEIVDSLVEAGLATQELRFESIGPTIGASLRQRAIIAVGLATLVTIVYLAYIFRGLGRYIAPWKFGVAAVAALVHDLLVMVAVMAIFGRIAGAQIDSLFLTAMLAVMGYSVNDTIVLFDRLNTLWRNTKFDLADGIGQAIRSTLVRSVNTSVTTLLVLVTLLVFGGASLQWFAAALIAGTVAGSYSTLVVAPPVLYLLAKRRRS